MQHKMTIVDDATKEQTADDNEGITEPNSNTLIRSDVNCREDETCKKRKNLDVIDKDDDDDDYDNDQKESATGHNPSQLSFALWEGETSDLATHNGGTIPSSSISSKIVMRLIQKETLRHLEFAWEAERKLARFCQQEEQEEEAEEVQNQEHCDIEN